MFKKVSMLVAVLFLSSLSASSADDAKGTITRFKNGDYAITVMHPGTWCHTEFYDPQGLMYQWIGPRAREILLQYDGKRRLERITLPDKTALTFSYKGKEPTPSTGEHVDAKGKAIARLRWDKKGNTIRVDLKTGKDLKPIPMGEFPWPDFLKRDIARRAKHKTAKAKVPAKP